MKITGPLTPKPITSSEKAKKKKSTTSTGFSNLLADVDDVEVTEQVVSIAAPQNISSMLSIQEVSEDEGQRQQAIKQGRLSLDALEKLRDALLIGDMPLSTIEKLEHTVKQQRQLTSDPLLNEILDDIELRAAVELAKLEQARKF